MIYVAENFGESKFFRNLSILYCQQNTLNFTSIDIARYSQKDYYQQCIYSHLIYLSFYRDKVLSCQNTTTHKAIIWPQLNDIK